MPRNSKLVILCHLTRVPGLLLHDCTRVLWWGIRLSLFSSLVGQANPAQAPLPHYRQNLATYNRCHFHYEWVRWHLNPLPWPIHSSGLVYQHVYQDRPSRPSSNLIGCSFIAANDSGCTAGWHFETCGISCCIRGVLFGLDLGDIDWTALRHRLGSTGNPRFSSALWNSSTGTGVDWLHRLRYSGERRAENDSLIQW